MSAELIAAIKALSYIGTSKFGFKARVVRLDELLELPELSRLAAPERAGEGWQPIETAPKDGSTIILRAGDVVDTGHWTDNSMTAYPWQGWTWHTLVTKATTSKPTHWMPLPSVPASLRGAETKDQA